MAFPLEPPVDAMLSAPQDEIPIGEGWRYEPKWDGFRAIIFRDGDELLIQSRKNQPLQRYFPELLGPLREALPARCLVDGEIIVPGPRGLDFDALQQRIHPAASRVNKLSVETPARFVAFDLIASGDDDLRGQPFHARRARLARELTIGSSVFLTPNTGDAEVAKRWFVEFEGAGMDGVIAKHSDLHYLPGERVMVKVKHHRTADCVVGGYREHKEGGTIGSLLLGLYDAQGKLHHVGHTAGFTKKQRVELKERFLPYEGGTSFGEGRTPGAPSRWSGGKDLSWTPLRPEVVCEVAFDHLQGNRFRHAATLLRWREDKAPAQCTFDQLEGPKHFSLDTVIALGRGS